MSHVFSPMRCRRASFNILRVELEQILFNERPSKEALKAGCKIGIAGMLPVRQLPAQGVEPEFADHIEFYVSNVEKSSSGLHR